MAPVRSSFQMFTCDFLVTSGKQPFHLTQPDGAGLLVYQVRA